MKFIVTRTSSWDDDKSPCAGAVKEAYVRNDTRTAARPEDIPVYADNTAEWYGKGKNHRVEDGQIVRDFDDTAWFLTVANMEDLIGLIKLWGCPVIVGPYLCMGSLPSIEIYDDYRE